MDARMGLPGGLDRRRRRATPGFTLIQLMVVVVIIAIILALALPSLFRSRIAANETAAIGTLKTLVTAQESYRLSMGRYATSLWELGQAKYVDELIGKGEATYQIDFSSSFGSYPWQNCNRLHRACRADDSGSVSIGYLEEAFQNVLAQAWFCRSTKAGYHFVVVGTGDDVRSGGAVTGWFAYAFPESYRETGVRGFYVDEGGVITVRKELRVLNYRGDWFYDANLYDFDVNDPSTWPTPWDPEAKKRTALTEEWLPLDGTAPALEE